MPRKPAPKVVTHNPAIIPAELRPKKVTGGLPGPVGTIKVVARERIYYDHVMRRPGVVFAIRSMNEFSKGMDLVDSKTEESYQSANQAINENRLRVHAGEEPRGETIDENDPPVGAGEDSVI